MLVLRFLSPSRSRAALSLAGILFAATAFTAFGGVGCGATVATVLESDDAAASPSTGAEGGPGNGGSDSGTDSGGSTAVACEAKGGTCVRAGGAPPSSSRKASSAEAKCAGADVCWLPVSLTKPPVCQNDQGCNSDASMSSFAGQCFGGICICKPGFGVQPDGRCGKTLPPDCNAQSGKCFQQPATCPAGSLGSSQETNMTCGDFIAAVCCFTESGCTGPSREVAGAGRVPIDMACCGTAGGASDRLCVNGWQTCQPGSTPVDKSVSGCL